jgi:hypothetical protein
MLLVRTDEGQHTLARTSGISDNGGPTEPRPLETL